MPIPYDREIEAGLAAAAANADPSITLPSPGDALALREITNNTLRASFARIPDEPSVATRDLEVPTDNGTTILVRHYFLPGGAPGSAVVYAHGGGMICGSVDIYDPAVRRYVAQTGVPFFSVDFRSAPEHTGDRLARDVFSAISWLRDNAQGFGVDPDRIAVMGDSGGGGVAAGAGILARDYGVNLAKQILIYPMIDDRNIDPDPELASKATWTYDNNFTGWNALLGDDRGSDSVSPAAAPARLTDFSQLAPAFIEVGELDIFRDESIAYAQGFYRAGISCELQVMEGTPHASDIALPETAVSRRALEQRFRIIQNL